MPSGRRESVLIFCISPITKMYLPSIEHYEPDTIHVFVGNGDDPISIIGRRNWDSVKSKLGCKNIIEHIVDISDYEGILGTITGIKKDLENRYGDNLDIFINISSGTPEFSSAGMFASMLPQRAIAFRVCSEYGLSVEDLSVLFDKLNGSIEIKEPEMVTGLRNDNPEDEMISFLNIVNDLLKETKYPKYRTIIDRLKEEGSWSYDPERKSGYGRTPLAEREDRYLKRHYIATALENGWIERPSANTMRLTPSGRAYVSVYGGREERTALNECSDERIYSRCVHDSFREPRILFEEFSDIPYDDEDTVTIGLGDKRYTFRIGTDQHR